MIPFAVTFLFALYETSFGIILGILTHMCMLLGQHMDPIRGKVYEKTAQLNLNGKILYPAADVRKSVLI